MDDLNVKLAKRGRTVQKTVLPSDQNPRKNSVLDYSQEKKGSLEKLLHGVEMLPKIFQKNNVSPDFDTIAQLRTISRQTYLKKRELQKFNELRLEILDEERLFLDLGIALNEQELQGLNYKREILALVIDQKLSIKHEDLENTNLLQKDNSAAGKLFSNGIFSGKNGNHKDDFLSEDEHWHFVQKQRSLRSTYSPNEVKKSSIYPFVFEKQIEVLTDQVCHYSLKDEETGQKMPAKKNDRFLHAKKEGGKLRKEKMPIFPHKNQILNSVENFQVLIVVAETGSGKTTQLTQYLHEAGYSRLGKIGSTQPRRVAAMSVAAHVAEEMHVIIGKEVGYSIRFEDCTTDMTVIKYMTDGMLLRELLSEPDLASYSVIIIDEAHERSLHTDIVFGLVKDISRFRPDLKVIISSATLDATKFSEFFDDAPIYKIPGRMYQVKIFHANAPEANYLEATVQTIIQIHASEPIGDILVFLTGQEEIETCEELLEAKMKNEQNCELICVPVYSHLPSELQARIFESSPVGSRKIVIATNIAETSLTIPGIKYVIDSGFVKQNSYNPRSGIETLAVVPISQASARQRAGRAGRTESGKCYRLFTRWSYENELEPNSTPEIQRANLSNVVLILKSLGIHDLVGFDFMDKLPIDTLTRALEELYAFGAIDTNGDLTVIGTRMADFPLIPQLAKALLLSVKYKVTEEIITIAAMLSCGNTIFYTPRNKQIQASMAHKKFFRGNLGDHIALMMAYNEWKDSNFAMSFCFENFIQARSIKRAHDMRDQIVGLMSRMEIDFESNKSDYDSIQKSVTAGYFLNVAKIRKDGTYQTLKNRVITHIHPTSSLVEVRPKYVIYHELILTTKEYMRFISEIKPQWLLEAAPYLYKEKDLEF